MANTRKKINKSTAKTPKVDTIKMTKSENNVKKITSLPNKTKKYSTNKAKTKPFNTNIQKQASKKPNNKIKKFYNLKIISGSTNIFKNKRSFIGLISLFVITVILILIFSTPTGVPEAVSNFFASNKSGAGYPVQPQGGKIIYSLTSENNIFSLTDTNFIGFNKNGAEILSYQHGFDNPSASSSAARNLIFNYKSNKYTITNFSKVLFSKEVKNDILLGTICNNGTYALVTKSTGYENQVDVYNKNSKNIYSWFSANEPVSNILLSNNGKRLVVVTVSAGSGDIKSTIYSLKLNSADPIFKYEIDGAVLSLKSYNNGFTAVTSNSVKYYNWNKGEIKNSDYKNDKISFFKIKNNGSNVIVTKNGIITNSYNIYVNKKDKELYNLTYNDEILDIEIHNNLLYILSNKKINVFNKKNEKVKQYELDNIASSIYLTDSGVIYCSNNNSIFKVK